MKGVGRWRSCHVVVALLHFCVLIVICAIVRTIIALSFHCHSHPCSWPCSHCGSHPHSPPSFAPLICVSSFACAGPCLCPPLLATHPCMSSFVCAHPRSCSLSFPT